jgi:hypothetical protein
MNISTNDYAAAEVVLLGNAQDVICGATKGLPFDDCPNQGLRAIVVDDTE